MSIGSNFRRIREKNGLTQGQTADKIGIKRTTYISYENSKTKPTSDVLKKFSEVFNISIDDLLTFDKEPPKSRFILEFKAPEVEYNPGVERPQKKLTSDEDLIINYYRQLEKTEKTEFFEKIKNAYLDIICGVDDE